MIINAKQGQTVFNYRCFQPFSLSLCLTHMPAHTHTWTQLCAFITSRHSGNLTEGNIQRAAVIIVIAQESSVMCPNAVSNSLRDKTICLFIFPGGNMQFCSSRCQGDENAERHCHIKGNLGPWSISKVKWYPTKHLIRHPVLQGRGQTEQCLHTQGSVLEGAIKLTQSTNMPCLRKYRRELQSAKPHLEHTVGLLKHQHAARPTMSGDNYVDPGLNFKFILSFFTSLQTYRRSRPLKKWDFKPPWTVAMPHVTTKRNLGSLNSYKGIITTFLFLSNIFMAQTRMYDIHEDR